MKHRLKYIIGIGFLLALIAFVWYHIPVKIQKTVTACTEDGEAIEVTFDIVRKRHLLGDEELDGTIIIGDVSYEGGSGHLFVPYGFTAVENSVLVYDYDDRFNVFSLYLSNEDEQKTYYGEAETVEEVEAIIRKIVGE